jgi:hypothetical protein
MPLISGTLAARLTRVLGSPSTDGPRKAQEWGAAYQAYALTATAGVLLPIFIGIEGQAFAARMAPALSVQHPSPYDFASALASGVEAFWLLPPVLFAGGIAAGAVTSFPGKLALVAGVVGVLTGPKPRHEPVAVQLANVIDAATRTVIVTFAPPPGSTATLL